MNLSKQNLSLKMARASLDNLPAFALPAGFLLRWYQPGDEAHWLRIHLAAERHLEITPALFWQQFGAGIPERGLPSASTPQRGSREDSPLQDLSQRQCYLLEPRGEVIGTGTAWSSDVDGARWGRLHWMAMSPEFQGRGLGKGLMTAICDRLRELGHERAYLHTSVARIPAIWLYLKFGFEPVFRNTAEETAWRNLFAAHRRAR